MKVVVFNLGCKVNQYESDSLVARFKEQGYEVSERLEPADVYVINTCAVTMEAEKKSRQAVARVKKCNPDAKIFVIGCASQNNLGQFEKDGVVYASGNAGKLAVADLPECGVTEKELPETYEELGGMESPRTRSYIKIQDGCNNFCTYCLIPYVRGRSRSRSPDAAAAEIRKTAKISKELVLTGINLSAYGKDNGATLTALINEISDVDVRIRLGSLEAGVITDELLTALSKLKKFCPQFHLSLQSGNDEVLKKMNRRYTSDEFFEKTELVRKYFPDAALTTDVITAFPTETEKQHKSTVEFIKKVAFADIHVFRYSKRAGTVAAKWPLVPSSVAEGREKELLELKKQLKTAYSEKFLGRETEVLFEDEEDGYSVGYTRHYVKVYKEGALHDEIVNVVPTEIFRDGLK